MFNFPHFVVLNDENDEMLHIFFITRVTKWGPIVDQTDPLKFFVVSLLKNNFILIKINFLKEKTNKYEFCFVIKLNGFLQ